jgi:uncharacterized protein YqiB (DUF1249 family)
VDTTTSTAVFIDSLIVPQCVYRPGSFTGLMTLYESNFIKLQHLVADTRAVRGCVLSQTPRDCDLYLESLRQEPYTSVLRLTYRFPDANGALIADPDIVLRVYHDAKLVEAATGCERHCHYKLRELAARTHSIELDRRWRNNILLNKWLDYVLDMGHGFPRSTAEQACSMR